MKKLVSILLTLAMIFAMATTAFANDTILTIDNDATSEIKYNGYQILNLTISLKTGDHHSKDCEGDTANPADPKHSDECFNYSYTVNPQYKEILQNETLSNGRNELWTATGKPTDYKAVTEAQILEYLSYQTSDSGEVSGTMRQVADRIYRAILGDNTIVPEKAEMTGLNDVIDQGYWLIADVSTLVNPDEAHSLVMVDTRGASSINVTPKTATAKVEKQVKDIEDSEDNSIADNAWHDSADHDIGDAVPFRVIGTLPSNAQYYTAFKMTFHDTISNGLTLDSSSIKVYMYDTYNKAHVDTDMNDYVADVTDYFTYSPSENCDCSFEVSCPDIFKINGVTKDSTFVVTYTAVLNESAVHGADGNPNTVYLEYSNDPYGTGTGTTVEDKVTVFTYKLVINKIDANNHPLEGAGFTLYKKDVTTNTYVAIGDELVGGTLTTFEWTGLDDGDYKLVETTVPDGYNEMEPIEFSISAAHDETSVDPQLIELKGGKLADGVVETGTITKDIVNHTGTVLPSTGAKGTAMLITMGAMLVTVAAVFMVTRKKMSIYED